MIKKYFCKFVLPGLFLCVGSIGFAGETLAPAYSLLKFELPLVGSYKLPPIRSAPDGALLAANGSPTTLYQSFGSAYTLLGFIYTTCSDVNGCPLTNLVFYQLKQEMQSDTELAEKLKLISISFDPSRDTPEVMQLFSDNFKYAGKNGSWDFLTAKTEAQLEPILQSYDQDVQRQVSASGETTELFTHIVRVFLIDPQKRIRNIYNIDFLHKDAVLNDIKTLILSDEAAKSRLFQASSDVNSLSGAGDDKSGYEAKAYQTNSKDLGSRNGQAADLLAIALNPPLGLPAVPVPVHNPLTEAKIKLGRKLFYDRRLSLNNTFSCGMCHIPEQGFTSNELATAVGVEGRTVRRNSPTIYNVAYATQLFHDAREQSLEQQVWGPLLAKNEMANPSIGYVVNKLKQMPDYSGHFETAFAGKGPNMETIGAALAAYQRTLISANSAFDQWHFGNQENALSDQAKRGYELFQGQAGCSSCHRIDSKFALFTDNEIHNTGLGYASSMGKSKPVKVLIAPGVFATIDPAVIKSVGLPPPSDLGYYEISQHPEDRWKYKTPTLRNIALTAPYMHNGSLRTLQEVVEFYNDGGIQNELLDPRIHPLGLSDEQMAELVAFMQSLTGSQNDVLIADAFNAPVGDVK